MRTSRMFPCITATWNPVTGCLHNCKYCWARKLVEGKLRYSEKYRQGFKPNLWEGAFDTQLGKNKFVFVCDIGDLFGEWVPRAWIEKTLNRITELHSSNVFMFLTKNPKRYEEFLSLYPENIILGTTLESNNDFVSIVSHILQQNATPQESACQPLLCKQRPECTQAQKQDYAPSHEQYTLNPQHWHLRGNAT